MKLTTLVIIVALFGTTLLAGNPPGKAPAQLDKLKTLVGTWQGKGKDGNPVQVSYKIISGGTALMETLEMGEHKEGMVTLYHLNGDQVMLTHYGVMGNQPRMKAVSSKDENTLVFSFVDATNLSSPDADHMHKVVFTFKDGDHFTQEWTVRSKGKDAPPFAFDFERVK